MLYIQLIIVLVTQCLCDGTARHYTFKEYSYVALPKYETFFQEYQSACQQSPLCQPLDVVDRLNCIRECISPSCFIEIYQNDKLEMGEIDVRLDSFKGCFMQRGIRHGRGL